MAPEYGFTICSLQEDRRFVGRVDGGVSAFQMGPIHIIAGMMGAGVFERYPRLRVSFGESGAGWLAYALHPPHGFRVRGPLSRPDETAPKRILAPAVQGAIPIRPD